MLNPEKTKALYLTRKTKSLFLPQNPLSFMDHDISWENKVMCLGSHRGLVCSVSAY